MNTEQIPYIRWGEYKSKEQNKPDRLEIEVTGLEQFESELTTNVQVRQKVQGEWQERILPLKAHESNNSSLLKQWNDLIKKKKIIVGSKLVIFTWLGISKYNRVIRKFQVEV
ncbi:MAG: hypothetical protein EPO37_06165 [Nitrosarchaeum sp.]|nr:MAG: hypothetical protein EPO37_06165 [Nitrosarchaeum sp.]